MHITRQQIDQMEKRYRTAFINSLPGYKGLHLVGTANEQGVTNLALFNSIFHVGANPPLLGMVVRPDTDNHDTLKNIKATGQYTLNNVLPGWYQQAHQASASYPSGVSEFEPCGFTAFYSNGCAAPYVQSSSIKIGLQQREIIEIAINNTTIVIGEIIEVIVEDTCIAPDGYVDHLQAGTVTVSGLDSYFTTNALGRLAYAKPDVLPHEL